MVGLERGYYENLMGVDRFNGEDYAQVPPAGCQRMALLGASHAMGSGVGREDTFEAVLEARLNQEGEGGCFEILNFAVYGYSPLFQIAVLEKVAAFQPKAILYVAHPEDSDRLVRLLVQSIREGIALSPTACIPWSSRIENSWVACAILA